LTLWSAILFSIVINWLVSVQIAADLFELRW